jgi:hypothetical protein
LTAERKELRENRAVGSKVDGGGFGSYVKGRGGKQNRRRFGLKDFLTAERKWLPREKVWRTTKLTKRT